MIEIMISLVILALISVNLSMVTRTGSQAYEAGLFMSTLEDQADQTMDRIAFALMSSSQDLINPVHEAPASSSQVDYEISLGYENGELILGDPERIALDPETGHIVWTQNPLLEGERSVTWSKWAADRPNSDPENGADDNDDGLVDEQGLSFDLEGNQVSIQLTIRRTDPDGVQREMRKITQITCRN